MTIAFQHIANLVVILLSSCCIQELQYVCPSNVNIIKNNDETIE